MKYHEKSNLKKSKKCNKKGGGDTPHLTGWGEIKKNMSPFYF